MQIYMKDGKALKINGGGGYLSPKASGETWVLNERPDFDHIGENISLQIDFVSDNMSFDFINVVYGQDMLFYGGPTTGEIPAYNSGEWVNQAYRTITFLESPTGDLLIWLQNNGTKQ